MVGAFLFGIRTQGKPLARISSCFMATLHFLMFVANGSHNRPAVLFLKSPPYDEGPFFWAPNRKYFFGYSKLTILNYLILILYAFYLATSPSLLSARSYPVYVYWLWGGKHIFLALSGSRLVDAVIKLISPMLWFFAQNRDAFLCNCIRKMFVQTSHFFPLRIRVVPLQPRLHYKS